jgi:hypothetical protein
MEQFVRPCAGAGELSVLNMFAVKNEITTLHCHALGTFAGNKSTGNWTQSAQFLAILAVVISRLDASL